VIAVDRTLAAFVERYILERMQGTRPATLKLYRLAIAQFSSFIGTAATIGNLNDADLAAFTAWMAERTSVTTANIRLAALKAFAAFAFEKHLLAEPVTLRKAKVDLPTPRAWRAEEFKRLLETCKELAGEVAGVPSRLWWSALFSVLLDTGWRISATLCLRWDGLWGNMLSLPATAQKHRRAETRFISTDTLSRLEAIRAPVRCSIFPWDCHRNYLWIKHDKILQRAGLPPVRQDKFHRVRRTTASHIAAKYGKAAAMEQLGHSRLSTTERYLDPLIVQPQNYLDALPRSKQG
jgi:integrase